MSAEQCLLCKGGSVYQYWAGVWNAPDKRAMHCTLCGSFFLDPPNSDSDQRKFDTEYDRYIQARAELVNTHIGQNFDALVDESIEIRFLDLKRFLTGKPSVLEIGAEKGGFLDRIAQSTGILAAVDSCPEYKEILQRKGYRAYSYVWDLPSNERYDRICLFSLLEHIHDPQPFLSRLKGCLSTDGLMIVEIPSANDPLLSLYDIPAFKSFYFQGMHPYVYSEKAVKLLLANCGMETVEVIHKQRYGLANHLQWLKSGSPGGNPEFTSLFAGPADSEYIKALETSGHTDTLYVIARIARP